MRLLQITASNVWRGHEQQIVYYYDAFESKVAHQVLICPTDTKLAQIATDKGYRLETLPFKSEYDLLWVKRIRKVVKAEGINVILIHNSNALTLCILHALWYRSKVPMVFFRTLIRRVDTNFFRQWKYNYKHLVKIVCVSQAVVEVLKPAIKDHSRFSIVGSMTDIKHFSPREKSFKLHRALGLSRDTVLIANVSAFIPLKDHVTFVRAAKLLKLKLSKAKFLLIGTGELEDDIKSFAKTEGLESDILFLGFRNDIPEIFPEFDLFLFTSKHEASGGVLLEAYASGVPIVAAEAGGIPEVVVNNKTGLLCHAENPEDFSDAALKILTNPTLKNALVTAGLEHLKTHFTTTVIAEKMFEELSNVL